MPSKLWERIHEHDVQGGPFGPPIRVTAAEPCEHCNNGNNRCFRSQDGQVTGCYNVGGTGAEERTDSGGSTYFVFGPDGREDHVEVTPPATKPERAGADELDRIYAAFLGLMSLSEAHESAMLARGFPPGEAGRRGYRTLPGPGRGRVIAALARQIEPRVLLSAPGFYADENSRLRFNALSGLLIPARDVEGRIIALCVRPDSGVDAGSKYLWVSSAKKGGPGPGAPTHVPMGVSGSIGRIVVTEGILKADLTSSLSGIATLGNPGVGNWRNSLSTLKSLGVRTVVLAYDMDWQTKRDVAKSMVKYAESIRGAGIDVEVATWVKSCKGIDDLLATGERPDIHAGPEADHIIEEASEVAEMTGGGKATANERVATRVEPEPDDGPSEDIIDRWPVLDEAAYHGIVGEIVRAASPHSEADPVAILVQFLVGFANAVGRGPHWIAGATKHFLALFTALVGPTAAGRKGSSWDVARTTSKVANLLITYCHTRG